MRRPTHRGASCLGVFVLTAGMGLSGAAVAQTGSDPIGPEATGSQAERTSPDGMNPDNARPDNTRPEDTRRQDRYEDRQAQQPVDQDRRSYDETDSDAVKKGDDGFMDADAAAQNEAAEGEYVVKKGDTLSQIAEDELGDAAEWKQIAQMNSIDDPAKLEVGKRLSLPGEKAKAKGATPSEASDDDESSIFN